MRNPNSEQLRQDCSSCNCSQLLVLNCSSCSCCSPEPTSGFSCSCCSPEPKAGCSCSCCSSEPTAGCSGSCCSPEPTAGCSCSCCSPDATAPSWDSSRSLKVQSFDLTSVLCSITSYLSYFSLPSLIRDNSVRFCYLSVISIIINSNFEISFSFGRY